MRYRMNNFGIDRCRDTSYLTDKMCLAFSEYTRCNEELKNMAKVQ